MVYFSVPPETDFEPSVTRGNPRTLPQEDLVGPYVENVNEHFTCYIRSVLPGKDSTSFGLYHDGKLKLQSKTGTGEVVETNEGDGTKFVEWKFSTLFTRSDNGHKFRCHVHWKAGKYEEIGLSKLTENTKVTCKCLRMYGRASII